MNVDNKLDPALIRKYFNKGLLLELFKYLKPSCSSVINGTKRVVIETNLLDLKKDIKNISDEEVKRKNLDLIAYLVEEMLNTVKKINNQK